MNTMRRCMPVALLALALCLAGCLGRASSPDGSNGDGALDAIGPPLPEATTPDALLQAIATTFAAHGAAGTRGYARAFCDSTGVATPAFAAYPSQGELEAWVNSGHAVPVAPMDLPLERRLFAALADAYQPGSLVLTWAHDDASPDDVIDSVPGTAFVHRHYLLEFVARRDASRRKVAVGFADLDLVRTGGLWQVHHWNDRPDPTAGASPIEQADLTLGWWRLERLAS